MNVLAEAKVENLEKKTFLNLFVAKQPSLVTMPEILKNFFSIFLFNMLSEWFYGVIFNTKEVMVILSNLCLQKPKNLNNFRIQRVKNFKRFFTMQGYFGDFLPNCMIIKQRK